MKYNAALNLLPHNHDFQGHGGKGLLETFWEKVTVLVYGYPFSQQSSFEGHVIHGHHLLPDFAGPKFCCVVKVFKIVRHFYKHVQGFPSTFC